MRLFIALIALSVILDPFGLWPRPALAAGPPNLTGTWVLELSTQAGPCTAEDASLTQSGSDIAIAFDCYVVDAPVFLQFKGMLDGTIDSDTGTFTASQLYPPFSLAGTASKDGQRISGDWSCCDGTAGGTFTAYRLIPATQTSTRQVVTTATEPPLTPSAIKTPGPDLPRTGGTSTPSSNGTWLLWVLAGSLFAFGGASVYLTTRARSGR